MSCALRGILFVSALAVLVTLGRTTLTDSPAVMAGSDCSDEKLCGFKGEAHSITRFTDPGDWTVEVDATGLVFLPLPDNPDRFQTVAGTVTTTFSGTYFRDSDDTPGPCIVTGSLAVPVGLGDGELALLGTDDDGLHYSLSGFTDYDIPLTISCPGDDPISSANGSLYWALTGKQVGTDPLILEGTRSTDTLPTIHADYDWHLERASAGLEVEVVASAESAAVDQGFHVKLRVTNPNEEPVTNVMPPPELEHTGGVEKVGGPHPASVASLGPDETTEFIYGYRAAAEGETTFGGEVTADLSAAEISGEAELACAAPSVAPQGPPPSHCQNIELIIGSGLQLIRFYVLPGHAWLSFQPRIGPQAGQELFYGRYPATPQWVWTEGAIHDDKINKQWTYRVTFAVTTNRYNVAADYINQELNPVLRTDYKIFSTNCMGLLSEVAEKAGITMSGYTRFLVIPDPWTFDETLRHAYQSEGAVWNSGVVEKNPLVDRQGDSDDESPDQRCSYTDIEQRALDGQATLAEELQQEFHKEELPAVKIATGGSCSVSLSNVDPELALLLVDFGDGSDVVQMATETKHQYAEDGLYHGRVITVDSGAVREWTFDVNVGAGSGACEHEVDVPDPPPSGWTPDPYTEPPQAQVLPEQPPGDANCDNEVNSVDALAVLRTLAGLPASADCLGKVGDVNCDGQVNSVDALAILRHLAGLPVSQPPGCPPIGGQGLPPAERWVIAR